MVIKLFAPEKYGTQRYSYHDATQEDIDAVAGGCGPGGVGDYLVPDTMYFLSVKPACSIHDWMYHYGVDIDDKILADRVFKNNMVRIIKAQDSWGFIENLRLRRAETYYQMVKNFGGPSFWSGKNSLYEFREVMTAH